MQQSSRWASLQDFTPRCSASVRRGSEHFLDVQDPALRTHRPVRERASQVSARFPRRFPRMPASSRSRLNGGLAWTRFGRAVSKGLRKASQPCFSGGVESSGKVLRLAWTRFGRAVSKGPSQGFPALLFRRG
jgi:hypothetical protein